MSEILIIGLGKMGKLTYRHLCEVEELTHFHIIDRNKEERFDADNVTFYSSMDELPRDKKIDYAFVLTPAVTHHDMMRRSIELGIRNIFVEKPAVCTQKEMDDINKLRKNCKIVVGYILRQSGIMKNLKIVFNKMRQTGFNLKKAEITYVKDKRGSVRNLMDIGIFEEVYHIWDMLFNCLNLKKADKIIYGPNKFEEDPLRAGRIEAGDIRYTLYSGDKRTDIAITSSFKNPVRKREFEFQFANAAGVTKKVILNFDTEDGYDKVVVLNDKNMVEYQAKEKALEKLSKQIRNIFQYFHSGNRGALHTISHSCVLQKVFDFTTQKRIVKDERCR